MFTGTGTRTRPITGAGGGVTYLLRDEFITDRSAGSVNGTPCEPGPGTRSLEELGGSNHTEIASGTLRITIASRGVRLRLGQVSSRPGLVVKTRLRPASYWQQLGMPTGPSGALDGVVCMAWNPSNLLQLNEHPSLTVTVHSYSYYTYYEAAMVRGSEPGSYGFSKNPTSGNWELLYPKAGLVTVNNVYPAVVLSDQDSLCDYLRVPSGLWLPTPIAYDTFTRADGSLGSTEATGPDGQSAVPRTWTTQLGTVQISSNAARATALSGGRAIATVDSGKADVVAALALTRGTTGAGLIVRYVDNDNYWYWTHDGTNSKLIERVSGAETTKITAARAYSAGARGVVIADGSAWRLFYNDTLTGTVTDSDLSSATKVGLVFFDADSTVDNLTVFARGTEGEYNVLERY